MSGVFLIVSIDCECDKGAAWRSQRPLAFEGVNEGIRNRLQPLFDRFGAKPTYLLSPEVMRDEKSVELLASFGSRAELGTHLHGEYAEPGAFEPEVTTVFQRDYPREVEFQKLQNTTTAFKKAFGYAPKSFRAGRFGIGPNSLGILEELGYAVDSSVTPSLHWGGGTDAAFDFERASTQPYHPDPAAPADLGTSKILEVPITIRPRFLGRFPIIGKHVEGRWLRPTRGTASALLGVARDEVRQARRTSVDRPVILNAMFHNVEIIPNGSPYAATEGQARAILERLGTLLELARSAEMKFVGLSDVVELVS